MHDSAENPQTRPLHPRACPSDVFEPPQELTPRELEILHLLVEGKRDAEIARALGLSVRTIENHVAHILTKLKVPTRTGAACFALQQPLSPQLQSHPGTQTTSPPSAPLS